MVSISVAVIDDLPLMRKALTSFILREPEFALVGEGSDGYEALRIAEEKCPDVFLMDLQMPKMDGIKATQIILEKFPHIKILAITTFYTGEFVIPALKAGVHGYLLKDARPQEVIDAVFSAMRGHSVLSQRAMETLNSSLQNSREHQPQNKALEELLTITEQKVLSGICRGLSNKEIAQELYLAESTIKSTVSRIMQKMQVSSRLQILVRANQSGFLGGD